MLTYTTDDGGATFAVKFDRWDGHQAQYTWTIAALGETLAEASDLRLGSATDADDVEALHALLDFVSAYFESLDYEQRTGTAGENGTLFPPAVAPLAVYADELACVFAGADS